MIYLLAALVQAAPVAHLDFTQPATVAAWAPTHDLGELKGTPEGLSLVFSGNDPYTVGPALDFPADQPLWLTAKLWSETGGTAQLFYGPRGFREEDSVRFPVQAGRWETATVAMPPLGPRCFLRFDPPGEKGRCTLASLTFALRHEPKAPAWEPPTAPVLTADSPSVGSGKLRLRHAPDQYGGFVLELDGQSVATGWTRPKIGYVVDEQERWFDFGKLAHVEALGGGNELVVVSTATDADGGAWEVKQLFVPGAEPGLINCTTAVMCSAERQLACLPLLVVLPGCGSFGKARGQGLLCGVEYLDTQDTSSSEADLLGPQSKRQVPDNVKVTIPLMAVEQAGRYVSLDWQRAEEISALFDSPDRSLGSGAHAMGLLYPGTDSLNRAEGSLVARRTRTLKAGHAVVCWATLGAGTGRTILPPVQSWVRRYGLPPLPPVDPAAYVQQAAAGWLDSQIAEAGQFRHAYNPGGQWKPQPAADAAAWMLWLASRTDDPALKARLQTAAAAAAAKVNPRDWVGSGVSHVKYPVVPLLLGNVDKLVAQATAAGRGTVRRFAPDGSLTYVAPAPPKADFASTHWSREANGFAAPPVAYVLETALLTGDAQLKADGLRLLHGLDKFADTVPRGAQTWEMPLHTPDILASAYLVKAYTLGYELTGDRALLDRAVDWAWTGVPFVYLVNPADQPVGPYATIAVLGATHWRAPNWIGMPVQWCGLVYAAALQRLAVHAPADGLWAKLADGIGRSGIQQSYPTSDRDQVGLLPDSYNLRPQTRNGPAINPGTVQSVAVLSVGGPKMYDYRVERDSGMVVHVAGEMVDPVVGGGKVACGLKGWASAPTRLLVVGGKAVTVKLDGVAVEVTQHAGWAECVVPVGTRRVEVAG